MFNFEKKNGYYIENAKSIDGKNVNFRLKFPVTEDFNLPKKLVFVDVVYYENDIKTVLFKICIGKKEIARRFFNIGGVALPFDFAPTLETIRSVDDEICYVIGKKGIRIVYTTVKENDIIVSNLDEMKEVIFELSNEFLMCKENKLCLTKR